MRLWPLVVLLVPCLVGCKDRKNANGDPTSVIARVEKEKQAARKPVLGQRLLEGKAEELRASPDGAVVTVLLEAGKPNVRGVPPTMRQGDLWAVATDGSGAQKLGAGVVNVPGGWLFSPDSKWILFNASWDPQTQSGELYVQDAKRLSADRARLGVRVSYFVPSDDGSQVAYVERGVLHAGKLPDGPFPELAGEVSTAEFSADGRYLYFKRKYSSGGGLYQVDLSKPQPQPLRLIDLVTEYTVLRSGKYVVVNARETPNDPAMQLHVFDVATGKGRKVADDGHRYRISRDGAWLAWRDNSLPPDKGALQIMKLPDGKPRKLGEKVNDFDFSADGKRFVFRDNYKELPLGGADATREDVRLVERVGDLMVVELPEGEPKLVGRAVPNFLFAPKDSTLAFTSRIERPEVTRRLFLYPEGAEAPMPLKDWLYEYQFDGDRLFIRSDCLREGRACELFSIAARPAPDEKPKKEVDSTFAFRFNKQGTAAVIPLAHLTDQTFDLVWHDFGKGEQKSIDQYVEWPAVVLDDSSVAYLVHEKGRVGVYVAKSL